MLRAIGKLPLPAQIADRLDPALDGLQEKGTLRPPASDLHQEPVIGIVIHEQQRLHCGGDSPTNLTRPAVRARSSCLSRAWSQRPPRRSSVPPLSSRWPGPFPCPGHWSDSEGG